MVAVGVDAMTWHLHRRSIANRNAIDTDIELGINVIPAIKYV